MKITRIIDSLTREEKIALVSGADQWHTTPIPRLNIPSIMLADGPHGLRKQIEGGDHLGLGVSVQATCFPPAATSANSWDSTLFFSMGQAIGEEALQEEVSVVLGPGVNIKRSPLCGRNFEYFSEDPLLTGELGKAWIKGLQSMGVGASLKHFAANNQERWRMTNDSLVDERALREIYLAGYEQIIQRAQPWTVMGAYNKLNGIYCCEHPELLNSILREEWGFQGAVLSDWGAVNDPSLAIKAGLDLEMPASYGVSATQIKEDLSTGRLTEAILNRSVRRVLELIFKGIEHKKLEYTYSVEEHHALARKIAAESAVLLKNEDGVLPVQKGQKMAVLGQFAEVPRYQGSGSSLINPTKLDTVLEQLEISGIEFSYARGYDLEQDQANEALIAEACHLVNEADVVVIFAGLTPQYESEGYDRSHLELPPAHNELIRRVAEVNPRVVVVLSAGAPVVMPWLAMVQGLLHTYLGGQAGAGAVVDLLFGEINPSGKLAETYPLSLADHPASKFFANDVTTTEYRESIFVGYRYYDRAKKDVLFPFGYGLSYTQFSYADLNQSAKKMVDTEELKVRCMVKNIGPRAGFEIVQLYVGKETSPLFRAPRELKGFQKVWLEPEEEKEVEFTLNKRSFAYYNVNKGDWHVETGEYRISIGASSRDLFLTGKVEIETTEPQIFVPDYQEMAPGYYALDEPSTRLSKEDFLAVYGKELPVKSTLPGVFHNNSTLQDLQVTRIGRIVARVAEKALWKMADLEDKNDPRWLMTWTAAQEMPLRSMVAMSDGMVPEHFVQGLLAWANGQYGRAIRTWLSH